MNGQITLLGMTLGGVPVATVQGPDGVLRRVEVRTPADLGELARQGWIPALERLRTRWENREASGENAQARLSVILEGKRQDQIDAIEAARRTAMAAVGEQVGDYIDAGGRLVTLTQDTLSSAAKSLALKLGIAAAGAVALTMGLKRISKPKKKKRS